MNLAQHRRGELHSEMRAMLDTAKAENRNLTAEEAAKYDTIEAEYDGLESEIGRIERAETRSHIEVPDVLLRHLNGDKGTESRAVLTKDQRMTLKPSGLSLARTIRAAITGDATGADAEVRALGITGGGSSLINGELANEVLDLARSNTVAIKAGAVTVPMRLHSLIIPKLTKDVGVNWRGENELITEDEPTFNAVVLTAKSLSGVVRISRELLADSPVAEAALMNTIAKAIGLAIDHAVLLGSGTDPEPQGIANASGVVKIDMGTNGAAFTSYDPLIDAVGAILAQNRTPSAYVANPRTAMALAKLKSTQGVYLEVPDALDSLTPYQTTAVGITDSHGTAANASSVIVGDFTQVAIGLREGIIIEKLVERFSDYGQIGFVVHVRADVAVLDEKGFSIITGVTP